MRLALVLLVLMTLQGRLFADDQVRVGTFDVDASPPIGSPMAYDPTKEVLIPLSCRGVVLIGAEKPIVLCAVDWLGIANASHREFREALAKAAGTTPDRVAVHTLHQHDAPWADVDTDELITELDIPYRPFDTKFVRDVIARAAKAVAKAKENAQAVTHVGLSAANVEKVASNRRVLGPDGKVLHVRWSATKDPVAREFPEGVIDPQLKMVTFFAGDKPLAALTYYATHPQSYYRTGKANPDFPGIARNARQEATGVPHIHFNGAAGNVTAGKYNDGAVENRQVLADRMASAMAAAYKDVKKTPLAAKDVAWETVAATLPPAPHYDEQKMLATINDKEKPPLQRFTAANNLAWVRRCAKQQNTIELGCLSLGDARVLHMPGELFVEYQLEAQQLLPEKFVAMAAYGDYGTAYIGTAIAYTQGGYETGPTASHVAPEAEDVLMRGIAKLLKVDAAKLRPLR
jgi:hypothetical protein